jgi:hypothetical protein
LVFSRENEVVLRIVVPHLIILAGRLFKRGPAASRQRSCVEERRTVSV